MLRTPDWEVGLTGSQVQNLMGEGGGRILAVQCLRNSTMSATFFGTMSSTIGFFVGKFSPFFWPLSLLNRPISSFQLLLFLSDVASNSFSTFSRMKLTQLLANEALSECGLRQIQEFVLAVALFWCFVHWLICIKGFTHLSFIMSAEDYSKKEFTEEELDARQMRIKHAKALLSDSTLHYAMGMFLLNHSPNLANVFNPVQFFETFGVNLLS